MNRIEKDFLGEIKIPQDAYYGSNTARALHNFKISGQTAPAVFMQALGAVKFAALETNHSLGLINKKHYPAMRQACGEFIDGKFSSDFSVDIFQAGAGTSYNMNANEIIANRANELLKGKKGEYKFVHPNNHVNMAQSTNDVIPTATRLAALFLLPNLLKVIRATEKDLAQKSHKYAKLLKVGRTHLQDAVPISLGREFDAYREAISKSRQFIELVSKELKVIGLGGTAVGTGINTHPAYSKTVTKKLSALTKIRFTTTKNATETTNNLNAFVNFSAALRSLAINYLNLAGDLKLMNMGPKAGLSEITLPPVQPGSSIMPGKVNPSIPESLEMVCMQTIGNDQTITLAAQKSQFEINVFCPLIMHNLLQSITILSNAIDSFNRLALKGIVINTKHIKEIFENSLCPATALSPHLGYELTADIVKTALKNNSSLRNEIIRRKILSEKALANIVSESAFLKSVGTIKTRSRK